MVSAARPVPVRSAVWHRRAHPLPYSFSHSTLMWVLDLDGPPILPTWLSIFARVRGTDHLGGRDLASLGHRVRDRIREEADWEADRILMFASARAFGYSFDPLSTYFSYSSSGELEGIVAEVHNTHGESHIYLMGAEAGQVDAKVEKRFYVSPFFTVEGEYRVRASLTEERVSVAIDLSQAGQQVFLASVSGVVGSSRRIRVATALLRDPLPGLRVAGLIRFHGLRLWAKKLPIVRHH